MSRILVFRIVRALGVCFAKPVRANNPDRPRGRGMAKYQFAKSSKIFPGTDATRFTPQTMIRPNPPAFTSIRMASSSTVIDELIAKKEMP